MTTGKSLSLFFYFCLFDLNQQFMKQSRCGGTVNLGRSRIYNQLYILLMKKLFYKIYFFVVLLFSEIYSVTVFYGS